MQGAHWLVKEHISHKGACTPVSLLRWVIRDLRTPWGLLNNKLVRCAPPEAARARYYTNITFTAYKLRTRELESFGQWKLTNAIQR